MPDVDEILRGAREAISVTRVFGEPHEQDGVTVIPAATVRGGGGGGGDSEDNGGGGFGLMAKPAGAYVIKDGEVPLAAGRRPEPHRPRLADRVRPGPAGRVGLRPPPAPQLTAQPRPGGHHSSSPAMTLSAGGARVCAGSAPRCARWRRRGRRRP